MLWSTAVAAPGLLIAALVLGEPILPGSWGGWAACAGLGLMRVVGQGGVAWSLGRLPAALIAVTVLIQPVVAALLGWLLFAETLTPVQALGGGGAGGDRAGAVELGQTKRRGDHSPRAPVVMVSVLGVQRTLRSIAEVLPRWDSSSYSTLVFSSRPCRPAF